MKEIKMITNETQIENDNFSIQRMLDVIYANICPVCNGHKFIYCFSGQEDKEIKYPCSACEGTGQNN